MDKLSQYSTCAGRKSNPGVKIFVTKERIVFLVTIFLTCIAIAAGGEDAG
ncbi:hypothetical protein GCM10008941_30140 [Rhizomicrobium palustre]